MISLEVEVDQESRLKVILRVCEIASVVSNSL